jgi:hypothetical protein
MATEGRETAPDKSVVLFGRVHISGLGAGEFAKQVHDVLTKGTPHRVPDGPTWVVGDVTSQSFLGEPAITGRLGKLHGLTARSYDEAKRTFIDVALRPEVAETVLFLIHCPSRIIGFEEKRTRISRGKFVEQFRAIYGNSPAAQLTTLDIDMLADEVEFLDTLAKLGRVMRARFKLVPTNPEPRAAYSGIDKMIRDMRAAKLDATVQAPPEGGLAVQDTFIGQAAQMVADGYGEATVEGSFDRELRETVKLQSRQRAVETLIDLKTDLQKGFQAMVEFIKETLRWGA